MFIFTRNKPIIVDLFTAHQHILEGYKVDLARNMHPEWWKHTPKQTEVNGFIPAATLKTCTGLVELNSKGIIIPLWTDIAFNIANGNFQWQTADRQTELVAHNSDQWKSYANPTEFGQVKINSAWAFKTNQNVDWHMTSAYWHHRPIDNYSVSAGIVNGFHLNMPLNVQLFLNLQQDSKFVMEAGTPLAQMVPLTDKPIELRYHLVSDAEFEKYVALERSKFINGYRHRIRNSDKPKCPFHWNSK